MRIRSLLWFALILLAGPIHAQQSSPARLHVLAALPDWTGLWETELSAQLDSGEFARSLEGSGPPPDGESASVELAFFARMTILGEPPYNAEWQRRSRADLEHARGRPITVYACSMGFPLVLDSPTPEGMFEALVTPEETLILYRDGEVRHIYTDGRSHPKPDDLWPTEMGDSVGHWQARTLVIDTIARKAGTMMPPQMPVPGASLSAEAHFTERLRMIDRDTMQDDLTIEDSQRFAHPWQLSFRFKRVTNADRMIGTNCTENDRNPVVDGHVTIAPPKESAP